MQHHSGRSKLIIHVGTHNITCCHSCCWGFQTKLAQPDAGRVELISVLALSARQRLCKRTCEMYLCLWPKDYALWSCQSVCSKLFVMTLADVVFLRWWYYFKVLSEVSEAQTWPMFNSNQTHGQQQSNHDYLLRHLCCGISAAASLHAEAPHAWWLFINIWPPSVWPRSLDCHVSRSTPSSRQPTTSITTLESKRPQQQHGWWITCAGLCGLHHATEFAINEVSWKQTAFLLFYDWARVGI